MTLPYNPGRGSPLRYGMPYTPWSCLHAECVAFRSGSVHLLDTAFLSGCLHRGGHSAALHSAARSLQQATHVNMLQLMEELQACGPLQNNLTSPSIALDGSILYMHGPLEASYRPNLTKQLRELLPGPISNSRSYILNVTDPSQQHPMRVRLVSKDYHKMQTE